MSSLQSDISETLVELVFAALDHGIGSVRAAGGPMTPFVMSVIGEERSLHRFVGEGVTGAKAFVATLPAEVSLYALAADAYVTLGDRQYDAIVVEAAERSQDFGHLFAQRYIPASETRPFQPIGNPVYMGKTTQLFGLSSE